MADVKRCTKCSAEKPVAEFSADRSKRDGRRPSCKTCDLARRRASADTINENRRRYYRDNAEVERTRARDYARERADEQRVRSIAYRAKNAARLNEAARNWRQANPEKARANNQRRRAQLLSATIEPFTFQDMLSHWEDYDLFACFYCGDGLSRGFEIDHFVPISKGGAHSVHNLVPACKPCNGSKSARDPWEFLRSALEARS